MSCPKHLLPEAVRADILKPFAEFGKPKSIEEHEAEISAKPIWLSKYEIAVTSEPMICTCKIRRDDPHLQHWMGCYFYTD